MAVQIRRKIVAIFEAGPVRLTPSELRTLLQGSFPEAGRVEVHSAVRELVESRELIYTNHFSVSCLERNPEKPRSVSRRLVLNGGSSKARGTDGCVDVRLMHGAAFGRGDHPTTLLCLRGVDYAVDQLPRLFTGVHAMALDVGTGSGVLAIASVQLGMRRAVGIDTDPIACHEASRNVAANGLSDRIVILNGDMGSVAVEKFHLLTTNLRPPTLAGLVPELVAKSPQGAYWVLSGFRRGEFNGIKDLFPNRCNVVWRCVDRGWEGAVVRLA